MQTRIMLACIIMEFIDRENEMARLDRLARREAGGLVVLYGRRRIGKTRLLLEWCEHHDGLYTVADQSTAEVQRRYFAEAVATRLPGFADVEYRDWRSLLGRLAREAEASGWRGPVVFDELPYLVVAASELPSVLQHWIDHEALRAGLVVAVAGSSQRMMQGLVLSAQAPLYGRAREILELGPIEPSFIQRIFGDLGARALVETYAAWGGVPRYWELAVELGDSDVKRQIDELSLDPLGLLHREPDRLLIEELPPALETRPVLDAIGGGVHRLSEIGGRIGRPATSMSRPLERLVEMGLVKREVPFGELEKKSRRSLYKIADPFVRLWFRVVAPHRGLLASSDRAGRLDLLKRYWQGLVGQAWEELCRQRISRVRAGGELGRLGPWGPAARWWRGAAPEWDVVSESTSGGCLLLGEAKWKRRPMSGKALERAAGELMAKEPPMLGAKYEGHEVVRALFVPEIEQGTVVEPLGVAVVTASDLVP